MPRQLRHSRAAYVVGALAPYNHGVPLAGESGNPAVLIKGLFWFILATQGIFFDWIPAFAGMTVLIG